MSILKMPMQIASSGKLATTSTEEEMIEQKIIDYLSTSNFQRPMSPLYGANTDVLVYENFDSLVFEEYKLEALTGLRKNVAGALITNMSMNSFNGLNDSSTITILVEYQIPSIGRRQATLDIVLPTDLNEDSVL